VSLSICVSVTLSLYVSLLVVWGFTRLYVFPAYILGSIFYEGHQLMPPEHYHRSSYRYFEGMLYILQCLHIYWYLLFWIMGVQFLKTGKTVDTQQNPGAKFDKSNASGGNGVPKAIADPTAHAVRARHTA